MLKYMAFDNYQTCPKLKKIINMFHLPVICYTPTCKVKTIFWNLPLPPKIETNKQSAALQRRTESHSHKLIKSTRKQDPYITPFKMHVPFIILPFNKWCAVCSIRCFPLYTRGSSYSLIPHTSYDDLVLVARPHLLFSLSRGRTKFPAGVLFLCCCSYSAYAWGCNDNDRW